MDKVFLNVSDPLDVLVDKCEEVLSAQPIIFQRMGELVHLYEEDSGKISFRSLKPAFTRYTLSKLISFEKTLSTDDLGNEKTMPIHPPGAIARCVVERGNFSARNLRAVVSFPPMASDGSIRTTEGYDDKTETYYTGGVNLTVPDSPTQADAKMAVALLEDILVDYPFEGEEHKSAWFAGLLSPLTRYMHDGFVPMLVMTANTARAGKSSLCKIIGLIVNGADLPIITNTRNGEEERKRVMGYLRSGASVVMIDNVCDVLGGPVINALLTSRGFADRSLGSQKIIQAVNDAFWCATGNNISLADDVAQRCLHSRLNCPDPSPHLRSGFRYPNLIDHVRGHRDELLSAALTIIRAYMLAGKPKQEMQPWGSFEEWSDIVRGALIYAGLKDPALSREELEEDANVEKGVYVALVDGWLELQAMSGSNAIENGLTAREAVEALENGVEAYLLKDALIELTKTRAITSHALGRLLMSVRGRNLDGKILHCIREDSKHGHRWSVKPHTSN